MTGQPAGRRCCCWARRLDWASEHMTGAARCRRSGIPSGRRLPNETEGRMASPAALTWAGCKHRLTQPIIPQRRVGWMKRPAPRNVREVFNLFAEYSSERGLNGIFEGLDFSGVDPRQIYFALHGRAPEKREL